MRCTSSGWTSGRSQERANEADPLADDSSEAKNFFFFFKKKKKKRFLSKKVRHTGDCDVTAAGIDLYFPPLSSKKNVGADGGTVRPPTAGTIGNFGRKLEI